MTLKNPKDNLYKNSKIHSLFYISIKSTNSRKTNKTGYENTQI